jgi:hypothetical protein
MSEARLAKFPIKENPRVGLSHPTLLTIIDCDISAKFKTRQLMET